MVPLKKSPLLKFHFFSLSFSFSVGLNYINAISLKKKLFCVSWKNKRGERTGKGARNCSQRSKELDDKRKKKKITKDAKKHYIFTFILIIENQQNYHYYRVESASE
jgi:hypothetical protein